LACFFCSGVKGFDFLLGFGLSQNAVFFFICNYNPKHVVTC
jgi:hypothetical protein